MRILEERRWASGDFRSISCKVCGAERPASAGRYAGDLDDVLGFPHAPGCTVLLPAAEWASFRNMLDSLADAYRAKRNACGLQDDRALVEHLDTCVQSLVEWWQLHPESRSSRKPR